MEKQKEFYIINKVTEDCNLACKYCYMKCNVKNTNRKIQDINTLKNILKVFSKNYEKIGIVWHGGEPLLPGLSYYKKVYEVEKYFIEKTGVKIENSMQTNGILLTEEYLDLLLDKLKMNIGISLDGDKEIQNYYRPKKGGKESFDETIEAYYLLKKKQGRAGIISVVSSDIVQGDIKDKVKKIYNFFKKINVDSWRVLPCCDHNFKTQTLTNKQFYEFYKTLFDIWYADDCQNKLKEIDPYSELIRYFKCGKKPSICSANGNCLLHVLCIRVNGDLTPCGSLYDKNFVFGNVNKIDSVEDIFHSENYRKLLKERARVHTECRNECNFYNVCGGGCRGDAWNVTGDYGGKYPYCEGLANLIFYIGLRNKIES